MDNVMGDMFALCVCAIGYWILFLCLERIPWSRIEAELEGTWLE